MAKIGRTRKSYGAVPVGDDEAVLGMSPRARDPVVMAATSAGDFAESDGALGAGMALPNQGEALAANGAAELWGIGGALAQNLHVNSGLSLCRPQAAT